MAPQYKLSYFDVRGLAEPIRLIFAVKGIEYEDNRIEREAWPEQKSNTPWGSLPVLHEGDKVLAQSQSIQRYLGKKYNLAGDSDFEAAKCDEMVEAMTDVRTAYFKAFMETDEAKKAEGLKIHKTETFPKYLQKCNDILQKNGTYFVGKRLSYADLNIASYLQIFSESLEGLLTAFPLVKAHQDTVFNTAGIKEWIAKRPKTQW